MIGNNFIEGRGVWHADKKMMTWDIQGRGRYSIKMR